MARIHRDYILLALRILETATSGPITNWINDRQKTNMEKTRISKRGVQLILPKLEAEGLVSKNGYYKYSLTKQGQSAKIFARSYGKTLFDKLTEIPFNGTRDQKILEFVRRFGLYIVYIFIKNSSPTVASSFYSAAIGEDDVEWISEAVDLKSMFEYFTNEVYPKTQKYSTRSKNFWVLMKKLETEFPEFSTLLKSEGDYFKSAFPDYYKKIIQKNIKKLPK